MASFGFYVIWQGGSNSALNLATTTPVVVATNTKKNTPKHTLNLSITNTAINNPPASSNSQSTSMMGKGNGTMMNSGIYKNGEYTGPSVDAYYGYVQVKAVITNGRLSDVVFLDYPQDRSTSIRINSRAMPILRQEAIAAQSANVNGVSGASATSPAFIESLTSALNQAKV